MEGVTGFPMRLWLHLASAPGAMTTPFLRVTKGQPERCLPALFAPELFELKGALPYELTPQLLAADADNFLRAAEMLPTDQVVEINCGCPCPTCIGAHAGSGILAAPEAFAATVERLTQALGPHRLAVKMRLGFAERREFSGLLPHVASQPLARLTVHGRTRKEGYGGTACWDVIGTAAAACAAPTWGSGDIVDLTTFSAARRKAPAAAGVLIGRGLLRNPWIFADLRHGHATDVDDETLGQALYVFALFHHLSLEAPAKLVARVANGRLPAFCGADPGAWERLAADLSALAFGAPQIFSPRRPLTAAFNPNVWPRLRYMWSFMRAVRSEPMQSPNIARAKTVQDFFNLLRLAANSQDPPGLARERTAVEIVAAQG